MNVPSKQHSFHAFSQGRPHERVYQTLSTREVAPSERYSFWAEDVVRSFELDAADELQKHNFRASVTSLATMSGEMHYAASDAYGVHLSRQKMRAAPFEELALFLMVDGRMRYAYGDGEEQEVGKGGFFLLDGTRPLSVRFTSHRLIQLDLARPLLASVFPGPMPAAELINSALAKSPLAGLLRDHLLQFPRIAAGMAPPEQIALLDASESFAITMIGGAFAAAFDIQPQSHAGLLAAAQRHIRSHLTNPDLTPATVAAAIGCSRSMLYQLFSQSELTVQGYIRELRLQQFMRLLQRERSNIPIQSLAERCGLYDAPNVNRMFRRHFGMSPSDARSPAKTDER